MENYRGRHIGCAPGTHEALVKAFADSGVKIDGALLDLGAHSGALLLRFQDQLGCQDLVGADLDPTRFDVPGAKFVRVELNEPFADHFTRKFSAIVATEVIEHLDNPRAFLAEIFQMLDDGGHVAITLPNVASWQGRIKFLLTGELWGFGEKNYRLQRHISPITKEQMCMMMKEIGLEPIHVSSGGSFATPFLKAASWPIRAIFSMCKGLPANGECAIFIARKTKPDQQLKTPEHYEKRWQGIPDKIGMERHPTNGR